ncbi:MAG: hypothetical protein QXH02_00200 [Desulfurococcaceae archaeon]
MLMLTSTVDAAGSVVDYIKLHAKNKFPGLLELLELHCKLKLKSSLLEAFITKPEFVFEVIQKIYSNSEVASLIMLEAFLKPVTALTRGHKDPRELLELLLRDPEEFKREIKKLLAVY